MKITRRQLRRLIRETLTQDEDIPVMTAAERIMQKIRSQPKPSQEDQLASMAGGIHKGYSIYGGQEAGPLDYEARSIVKGYDKLTYPDSLIHAGFIMIPTPGAHYRTSSWFHKDSKAGAYAIDSKYIGNDAKTPGIDHFKTLAAKQSEGRIPVEMDSHPYDAPENPIYKKPPPRPNYY